MTEELRRQIAADALCSCGSGIAWHSLLTRKTLRLGFFGGSVTQGYAHQQLYEKAYPALISEILAAQGFGVHTAVCAEAGMDTMTGNLLAEEIVLSQQPDLVFLEYAINETTLPQSVLSFESLLRKLLTAERPPVVCLLLMRSMNGYSCESFMLPIAEHYGLPCISVQKGTGAVLDAGLMRWPEFADAESHPNPEGHRLLAECVMHLLRTAVTVQETSPQPLPEPWLGAPFAALKRILPGDPDAAQTACPITETAEQFFPRAWKLSAPDSSYTLTLQCRALVLFYELHHLPEYGSCRVLLDGKPLREPLRSNSLYGWGNPRHAVVLQADTSASHTVRLEPTDGSFLLLAIGYV